MSSEIKIVPGHHRCTSKPKRTEKVKCTWCLKKMLGNSFPSHVCIQPKPEYMSYDIVGIASVASLFAPRAPASVIEENVENSLVDVDIEDTANEIVQIESKAEEKDELKAEEKDEVKAEEKDEVKAGEKRHRQKSIFEMFGKLKQFETHIEKLTNEIDNPEQVDYMKKIQTCLKQMQRAESDILQYKAQKKKKLKEIEELQTSLKMSIEDKAVMKKIKEENEAKILALTQQEISDRIVSREELRKVEKRWKDVVSETLKIFPSSEISEDGKFLECCNTCNEENWRKAKLKGLPNKNKVKIGRNLKYGAKRHVTENSK